MMGKKSIEQRFSTDIDAYINGKEISKSKLKEYNGLLELGKILANNDFSQNSNKESVINKAFKNHSKYKGENYMLNSNKNKRYALMAASLAIICLVSISLTQTSFAKRLVEVIRSISLGHITVEEISVPESAKTTPIPDNLKGKIFDEDGKPIEIISEENINKLYTADGEKIYQIKNEEIITVSQKEKMDKELKLKIEDSSKLNDYVCFNVILPSYLPEGYKFDTAEYYKDEQGVVDDKYATLQFTNKETGQYFLLFQRLADEEGAYELAVENEIEEIKINGINAIFDGRNIHWEANNVIYMLAGRGEISKDELIKIAESIK